MTQPLHQNPPESNIERTVRLVLREHGRLHLDPIRIDAAADLYAAGLTSMASVHVLLALESALGIEFPDAVLDRSLFASINSLSATAARCARDDSDLEVAS
jgi:acyl carrier protein